MAQQGENQFKRGPEKAGRRGKGRLLPRPPRLTPRERRPPAVADEFEPEGKRLTPIPGPKRRPSRDPEDTGGLGPGGLSDPLRGQPLPTLPTVRGRRTQSAAAGAASTDFVFFRNQPVPTEGNSSSKGEPSVGNDRNVIVFTGNKYSAVSTDNGISFTFVDPKSLGEVDGGYCCDQIVNASDEDSEELVVWLLQYYKDTADNTIRLITYEGKGDVEAQSYCTYDFQPADFGLPTKRWLDFNVMENSDEWLYVSSNIFDFSDDNHGSVVWRIALDDMTDGDCTLENGWQYYVNDGNYSSALVQGAGSTMYWAVHEDNSNSELHIYYASDSSTSISSKVKNITNYSTGDATCTVPDGNNPCGNLNTKLLTGWTAGGKVGWLWNVPQGDGYAFPRIHGAIFKTSDLSLVDEPVIWNSDYAWVYPAAGVNNRGHLGVTLYRIGGGKYPRARAFIIDDVEPSWGAITVHGIATSTDVNDEDKWGDYGGTRRYDGCSYTWLAGVFIQTGSAYFGTTEPRFVWFGRERDGCPDLIVESLSYTYAKGTIQIADTTRNTGSGTAAASKTRYYLSKDTTKSSGDTLLDSTHSVPSLARSASDAKSVSATAPSLALGGAYYVIACADDPEAISEVTDTNNCKAGDKTITLPPGKPTAKAVDFLVLDVKGQGPGRPGGRILVKSLVGVTGDEQPPAAVVRYYLDVSRQLTERKVELQGTAPIDRWPKLPRPIPRPPGDPVVWQFGRELAVIVPRGIPPGDYFLFACVSPARQIAEPDTANNCLMSQEPLTILPAR